MLIRKVPKSSNISPPYLIVKEKGSIRKIEPLMIFYLVQSVGNANTYQDIQHRLSCGLTSYRTRLARVY